MKNNDHQYSWQFYNFIAFYESFFKICKEDKTIPRIARGQKSRVLTGNALVVDVEDSLLTGSIFNSVVVLGMLSAFTSSVVVFSEIRKFDQIGKIQYLDLKNLNF